MRGTNKYKDSKYMKNILTKRERERRQTFFTYGIICRMRSKPRAHDKLRKRTKKSPPNET